MSEGVLAPPRLPSPTGAFDSLMRDMLERMQEQATGARATMGTITGFSGGSIIVWVDGERISRSVGFSRKKGVAYKLNDRVLLEPTRSDEYVVTGIVGSDAGDARIENAQIGYGAITIDELHDDLIAYIDSKGGSTGLTQTQADARYVRSGTCAGKKCGDDLYASMSWANTLVDTLDSNNNGYLGRLCKLEKKVKIKQGLCFNNG